MKSFTLFKRTDSGRLDPADPAFAAAPWYFKFNYRCATYLRCLETPNKTEAARRARLKYNEITAAVQAGEFNRIDSTKLRQPRAAAVATLSDILPWYRKFQGRIKPSTIAQNIAALRSLLLTVHGDDYDWEKTELTALNDDLIWRWKQKILAQAHAGDIDPSRAEQLQRSANSRLLQARSLFARSRRNDFPDYYRRAAGIELPPCLTGFREHPAFGGVEKHNYNSPSQRVISQTLHALTTPGKDLDQDMRIACWCAIGFGLRSGEISKAIRSDFKERDGDVYFEPVWRAKNNEIPSIGVQLDAWKYLAPLLAERKPDDYILRGTATQRNSDTARRISDWMRGLGWATTHHLHELRAWAGCQIVMGADGQGEHWERGRIFMRHAQVATTQNYYGQHIKVKLEKIPLPQISVPAFEPRILSA